jgi:hypothetical protein
VIEGYLSNSNGILTISESTFKNCKVDTKSGLGGAIYIKISNGGENKYSFNGASYSLCSGLYGKSLFIDSFDLKLSLQGSNDGLILGRLIDATEAL